jgi:hypothetical protein
MRRDAGVKRGSVVTGLRMEPDLATALTEAAHRQAQNEGEAQADVNKTSRCLLRRALGWSTAETLAAEARGGWAGTPVAGLGCESALIVALDKARAKLGLNRSAAARHFLRVSLGWSPQASLEKEKAFAAIAAAREKLMRAL